MIGDAPALRQVGDQRDHSRWAGLAPITAAASASAGTPPLAPRPSVPFNARRASRVALSYSWAPAMTGSSGCLVYRLHAGLRPAHLVLARHLVATLDCRGAGHRRLPLRDALDVLADRVFVRSAREPLGRRDSLVDKVLQRLIRWRSFGFLECLSFCGNLLEGHQLVVRLHLGDYPELLLSTQPDRRALPSGRPASSHRAWARSSSALRVAASIAYASARRVYAETPEHADGAISPKPRPSTR